MYTCMYVLTDCSAWGFYDTLSLVEIMLLIRRVALQPCRLAVDANSFINDDSLHIGSTYFT